MADSNLPPSGPAKPRPLEVLLVDNHPLMDHALRRCLEKRGYSVRVCSNLACGKDRLADSTCDLLLVDLQLPDGDGADLLPLVPRGCSAITMSGYDDPPPRIPSSDRMAHLIKPFAIEKLDLLLKAVTTSANGDSATPAGPDRAGSATPAATPNGSSPSVPRRADLPEAISLALKENVRRHTAGELSMEQYADRLARLEREELTPRGMSLTLRRLGDGTTRFLIKSGGTVHAMYDCQ